LLLQDGDRNSILAEVSTFLSLPWTILSCAKDAFVLLMAAAPCDFFWRKNRLKSAIDIVVWLVGWLSGWLSVGV